MFFLFGRTSIPTSGRLCRRAKFALWSPKPCSKWLPPTLQNEMARDERITGLWRTMLTERQPRRPPEGCEGREGGRFFKRATYPHRGALASAITVADRVFSSTRRCPRLHRGVAPSAFSTRGHEAPFAEIQFLSITVWPPDMPDSRFSSCR